MKRIVFFLAAFAALNLSAATRQDPPPGGVKVNIDPSCPATVTANTVRASAYSSDSYPATQTVNRSSTHDARTTVTDSQGNQSTYTTASGHYSTNARQQKGSEGVYSQHSLSNTSTYGAENKSKVSRIDVSCSPKE